MLYDNEGELHCQNRRNSILVTPLQIKKEQMLPQLQRLKTRRKSDVDQNIGVINRGSGKVGVEDRASGAGEDESTDESAGLSAVLWVAIILGGLLVAGCIVFFVFRCLSKASQGGHVVSMGGDVEMSAKLRRRQESESRYWVPPPPRPAEIQNP